MNRRTEAGAIATVRWFLASMNYAGTSGDTAPFRATYTDFCVKCEAIAQTIDRTYARGGFIRGGDWLPKRFEYYGMRGDVGYIDSVVDYASQVWLPSSDAEPQRFERTSDVLKAFQLRWRPAQGWIVGALDPES